MGRVVQEGDVINRRDLLRFFGAGAAIAPLAHPHIAARLIEPATIEIIKPSVELASRIDLSQVRRVSVSLTMADGSTHVLKLNDRTVYADGEVYSTDHASLDISVGSGSPVVGSGFIRVAGRLS